MHLLLVVFNVVVCWITLLLLHFLVLTPNGALSVMNGYGSVYGQRTSPQATSPGAMEVFTHNTNNMGGYIQAASPQPVAYAINVGVCNLCLQSKKNTKTIIFTRIIQNLWKSMRSCIKLLSIVNNS